MSTNRQLRIAFVHPDLGIGGAERLVVHAAGRLKRAGHEVAIYTAHHDEGRCFEETADGNLAVYVRGDRFPAALLGRFTAPCSIIRTCVAACAAARSTEHYDLFFCDLVSHCIPILSRSGVPVIFYCHYPDKLLAPRTGLARRLYRFPIDWWEERATGKASRILVNSHFTASAFSQAFPSLKNVAPHVLRPAVDIGVYEAFAPYEDDGRSEIILLSINRFETRKNLALAIETFVELLQLAAEETRARLRLLLAGGYDDRLEDNRRTLSSLRDLVGRKGIEGLVRFELSISETKKLDLLRSAFCVLYTPENEHFGFGPIEAMAAGRPIIVTDSGGPLETVEHEHSGLICRPRADDFADAVLRLISDPSMARSMGEAGRLRARDFGLEEFGESLSRIVDEGVRSG